jgi:D-glycero-alpha-D-manno-heptose-7-phosphate kinase
MDAYHLTGNNMKKIKSRAPLRLGLAGGGTDVSPFCDEHGGYVLNVTIDLYAHAVMSFDNSENIIFNAPDIGKIAAHDVTNVPATCGDLPLHLATYRYMMNTYNDGVFPALELTTYCDAPVGSGLGSSSTLVVAMVKAYCEFLSSGLDNYEIARIAHYIERVECKLNGGRQDQYSAAFGGVNFMEFYDANKTIVNPISLKNWILCELETNILLYFTGASRDSAKIIEDQSHNVRLKKKSSLAAMQALKNEAVEMKEALLKANFIKFAEIMQSGWVNKKKSSTKVTNPEIEKVYNTALEAGALAGKVSGAGGGGFMIFYVPNQARVGVIEALNKYSGKTLNCHLTHKGCEAWTLP